MYTEQEVFHLPVSDTLFAELPYTVTDFTILSYKTRKGIDYETIFWN